MGFVIRTTGWEDYMDPAGGSWVKELMLGAPDVGKTRSASFWPKPIFADCEDGRMSLADRKVPYGRVRATADMDALITQLQFDAKRPPEKRKYLTLVLDTIDHYQKIAIGERLRSEGKEALSGWADWGWLDGHMVQFVEKLLNLEMNIVVNCHYKQIAVGGDDDDKPKQTLQELRLKGDVKQWLLEEFDLIGMMETYHLAVEGQRVRKRRVRWHNSPAFPLLKDRSGSLPEFTEIDFTNDDYTRVFDALMSRVDDLPESEQIDELETEEPVAVPEVPVSGGPVDVGPLPVKKATPAKKAVAKKVTKKVAEAAPGEAVVEEVSQKGTKYAAVTVDANKAVLTNYSHAHAKDGTCIRNLWSDGGCHDGSSLEKEKAAEVTPEPAKQEEVTTDVPKSEEQPTPGPAEAEANVAEVLGGEKLDDSKLPDKYCGKQPSSHAHFPSVDGCGKDLKDEVPAKVNLALLRAKTMLCTDCLAKWKAAQAA